MSPAVDPLAFFSQANSDGVSVRSHLTELIHRLLQSKDPDALKGLESLSLEVKASHFKAEAAGQRAKPEVPAGSVSADSSKVTVPTEAWLKQAKALQTTVDPETTVMPSSGELPDQLPMFEWAGVGLRREEAYQIYLAMAKLREAHSLQSVRFFGKITGTRKDYVIVEGVASSPDAHIKPQALATPPEEPGVGLNKCVYFVAPSAAEPFVQLEDVTPEAVVASSQIRKYFTGDLSAPVACYPAFPGAEAAYLRAQIARIAAATVVAPVGKFSYDEENSALVPAEDPYAVPDSLPGLESWAKTYGAILKIGRCTNVPPPPTEDGEEPEPPEQEEVPPLGALGEEPPVATFSEESELPAWSSAMYNTVYDAYGVAIAKCHRWPGAYAAIAKSGDQSACIYIGSGHEAIGKAFTPVAPPAILSESAETDEFEEVGLAEENALLKAIDEAKLTEPEEGAEE